MSFIVREDRLKIEYFSEAKLGGFFHLDKLFCAIVEETIAHKVDGWLFFSPLVCFRNHFYTESAAVLVFPVFFFYPFGSHFPLLLAYCNTQ